MKTVITLGRQFGSGGKLIGEALSKELKIPYYDKEILNLASKSSGINEDFFREHDEKPNRSLLFSMVTGMRNGIDMTSVPLELPLNHKIFLAQFDTIKKLAREEPCIIVGRCADYVLKDEPHVLKVFIYAELESRIQRISESKKISERDAADLINKADKERNNYYNYFSGQKWGQSINYDLCINTTHIRIDQAVQLIESLITTLEKDED